MMEMLINLDLRELIDSGRRAQTCGDLCRLPARTSALKMYHLFSWTQVEV